MATYTGTTLNDRIFGSSLADLISGLGGNDELFGSLNGEGHDTLDGGAGSDTLRGGTGNHTYVIDSGKDIIVETGGDAEDRLQSSITVDLQNSAYDGVEHVTLTGTSALNATGDDSNNQLIGNSGNNKLDGKGADDTMIGGAGNDTYEVGALDEQVIEYSGGGTDQVNSTSHFTLGAYVENLTLTGTDNTNGGGNVLANKITGNSGNNGLAGDAGNDTLTGNDGNDTLDGDVGADSLSGGKGDDVYVVDEAGDKVSESGGASDIDRVESFLSYVLGSNIEDLLLRSTGASDGTGNSLANDIAGGLGNNILSGLGGADSLAGSLGEDLLIGGDGDDLLQGNRDGDTLVGGAGVDRFMPLATATGGDMIADLNAMPGGDRIDLTEVLTGVTAVTASQYLQATVVGGSTLLRIDSDGGANDFKDLVMLLGVGTDLDGLIANAVFDGIGTLTATPTVGGTGADNLLGGAKSTLIQGLAGNDTLTGNGGFDTLDGGTGSDSLLGSAGSDTYIVDVSGDKISDSGGNDDRVISAITIDLQSVAFDGIEHATLSGTGAINVTGDEFANMLVGSSGANKLDGKAGADTLAGGGGGDIYEVDSDSELIIEFAGDGTDQVNSAIEYFILPDQVENGTAIGNNDGDIEGNASANKLTGDATGNALYGNAGNDTLTGNDGDDLMDGGIGADSLVGGKGTDIYVVDDVGDKLSDSGASMELEIVWSYITFTLGTNFDRLDLQGSADIDGTGNTLGNSISGNDGDNVLLGLAGDDQLFGGLDGTDLLLGGDGNDILNAGTSTATFVGGAGQDILVFDSTSNFGADVFADFDALPGQDRLAFSGILGGGLTAAAAAGYVRGVTIGGNTQLQIDKDGGGNNYVTFATLQGVSIDLDGMVANAVLDLFGTETRTSVTGGAGNDTLAAAATSSYVEGLAGNDTLSGGAGFDTLDGGAGADTMDGGAGDDTYIVDNVKDQIFDTSGSNDRIRASITIDLQNDVLYGGVNHVTLTGTAAINATGDEFSNMLIGNSGANKLDGKAGADTMIGGAGSDIYEVDAQNDQVIEYAGEGTDQVNSKASSFTLGEFVENLTLLDGASNGTGNDLANKITGNSATNSLTGGEGNDTLTGNDGADVLTGGAGADSMVGGAGIDIYSVDDVGDKISETSTTEGGDTVNSSISYVLGNNLENLNLEGLAVDGTGNSLANIIVGNASDNVLNGLAGNDSLDGGGGWDQLLGGDGNDRLVAGDGVDTLVGGAGSDVFAVDTSLDGLDVIADFNGLPGGDILDLSALLTDFNPATGNINNFVHTAIADGNTTIQIDQNGATGGATFVDVLVLQGITTDVLGLLSNGSLALSS